jgi:hypothetical protein
MANLKLRLSYEEALFSDRKAMFDSYTVRVNSAKGYAKSLENGVELKK